MKSFLNSRKVFFIPVDVSIRTTLSSTSTVTFQKKSTAGFTLLEVLIALALVAVLMAAALPYMADAWHNSEGEHVSEAIATKVIETRSEALLSGETRFLSLTDPKLVPKGWKIQIQRINDKKFRNPMADEVWQFNNEGICDPIAMKLSGKGEPIIMKFDPITGQVLHEE